MPIYRAYPVSKSHQVAAALSTAVPRENGQRALQKAQQWLDRYAIELSDGPRFIDRLKAIPQTTP